MCSPAYRPEPAHGFCCNLRVGFWRLFYGQGQPAQMLSFIQLVLELFSDWHFLNIPFPVSLGARANYLPMGGNFGFEFYLI